MADQRFQHRRRARDGSADAFQLLRHMRDIDAIGDLQRRELRILHHRGEDGAEGQVRLPVQCRPPNCLGAPAIGFGTPAKRRYRGRLGALDAPAQGVSRQLGQCPRVADEQHIGQGGIAAKALE